MSVTKVVMPKLSEAMETGKLIKWIKKEGDRVSGGDILAEVETDKADVEMEAFGSGVLRKILVKEGDTVPVGSLIAVIAEPSDDIASVVGAVETTGAGTAGAAAPAPAPSAASAVSTSSRPSAVPPQPKSEDYATIAKPEPAAQAPAGAAATTSTSQPSDGGAEQPSAGAESPREPTPSNARVKASPLARKIAAQSGVDLKVVSGTGPGGRVVRKDVEASIGGAGSRAVATPAPAQLGPEYEDQP